MAVLAAPAAAEGTVTVENRCGFAIKVATVVVSGTTTIRCRSEQV